MTLYFGCTIFPQNVYRTVIIITEVSQVYNLLTSRELKGVKGVRGVKDNTDEGYQNPSIVMSLTPLTPTNSFDSSIHAKVEIIICIAGYRHALLTEVPSLRAGRLLNMSGKDEMM
jgi:hypothetical protein